MKKTLTGLQYLGTRVFMLVLMSRKVSPWICRQNVTY